MLIIQLMFNRYKRVWEAGLLGLGLGLGTQALQRYKAKAKADINEPHCHRTEAMYIIYLLRFTDACVHL